MITGSRRRRRARTVFETVSGESGRVRVIEDHRERRLIVRGETLSIYPLNGDWTALRREYWWRALVGLRLPPRPSVLFVGLGGGTQVHLLERFARPRAVSIIERDAVILNVALDWFGLRGLRGLEFLCTDANRAVPALAAARRRFDFVMEDATYGETFEASLPLVNGLVPLVTSRGTLVLNRHRRGDADAIADHLRPLFLGVQMRRVRREGENVLITARYPINAEPSDRASQRRGERSVESTLETATAAAEHSGGAAAATPPNALPPAE